MNMHDVFKREAQRQGRMEQMAQCKDGKWVAKLARPNPKRP